MLVFMICICTYNSTNKFDKNASEVKTIEFAYFCALPWNTGMFLTRSVPHDSSKIHEKYTNWKCRDKLFCATENFSEARVLNVIDCLLNYWLQIFPNDDNTLVY